MLHIYSYSTNLHPAAAIAQIGIVTVLIVTVTFFLILLILGVRKSYKLKAENERLSEKQMNIPKDDNEEEDYSEGHLYD